LNRGMSLEELNLVQVRSGLATKLGTGAAKIRLARIVDQVST
jgi:hypothetical protein